MDNPLNRLTTGERLVLNAICVNGGGYAGAASALRLAMNTIKQHLVNARRKTNLSNEQLCYELGRERR